MRRSLLVLAFLAGCRSPTVTELPVGVQSFAPPAVYREWWRLVQSCAGVTGDFDAIAWYVLPGTTQLLRADGHPIQGIWYPAGNRIVLTSSAQEHGGLVRHEMLHVLLGSRAVLHPRQQFLARCGGVVECDDQCVADGGAPLTADRKAVLVDPAVLSVEVEVTPGAPSSARSGGHFQMVVTARNPTTRAVVVRFPPARDAGPSLAYQYVIEGMGGFQSYNVRVSYPEIGWFAAGEEKRFVFDFRIGTGGSRGELPPGTYRFRGAYGAVWSAHPPTITLAP